MIVKVVELQCNHQGCECFFSSRRHSGYLARIEASELGWTHVLTVVTKSGPAMSEDFCPQHRKDA